MQVDLDIPAQLESRRLRLRPYQIDDGGRLRVIFLENREHLSEAIAGVKVGLGLDVTTHEGADQYVLQLAADWIACRRFVLGMYQKSTDQLVGELWIECLDWRIPLHEIGYFVVEDQSGRGFATEAARAGLAFIFDDLRANKARLTCAADNIASVQVAIRCGFSAEGRLRIEIKRDNGTLVDKLIFGMIRAEFKNLSPAGPRNDELL